MSSELDRQGLLDIFVMEAAEALAVLSAAVNPPGDTVPSAPRAPRSVCMGAQSSRSFRHLRVYGPLRCWASCSNRHSNSLRPSTRLCGSRRWCVARHGRSVSIATGCHQAGRPGGPIGECPLEERGHDSVAGFLRCVLRGWFERAAARTTWSRPSMPKCCPISPLKPMNISRHWRSLTNRLKENPGDAETIQALYRTAHTLKGSAHTIGFKVIGDIAHPIESCMIAVRDGHIPVSTALLATIGDAAALIRLVMRRDESHLAQLRMTCRMSPRPCSRSRDGQPVGAPAPAIAHAQEPPRRPGCDGRSGAVGCHGSARRCGALLHCIDG